MDNDWSKTGEQSKSDTNRKAVGSEAIEST